MSFLLSRKQQQRSSASNYWRSKRKRTSSAGVEIDVGEETSNSVPSSPSPPRRSEQPISATTSAPRSSSSLSSSSIAKSKGWWSLRFRKAKKSASSDNKKEDERSLSPRSITAVDNSEPEERTNSVKSQETTPSSSEQTETAPGSTIESPYGEEEGEEEESFTPEQSIIVLSSSESQTEERSDSSSQNCCPRQPLHYPEVIPAAGVAPVEESLNDTTVTQSTSPTFSSWNRNFDSLPPHQHDKENSKEDEEEQSETDDIKEVNAAITEDVILIADDNHQDDKMTPSSSGKQEMKMKKKSNHSSSSSSSLKKNQSKKKKRSNSTKEKDIISTESSKQKEANKRKNSRTSVGHTKKNDPKLARKVERNYSSNRLKQMKIDGNTKELKKRWKNVQNFGEKSVPKINNWQSVFDDNDNYDVDIPDLGVGDHSEEEDLGSSTAVLDLSYEEDDLSPAIFEDKEKIHESSENAKGPGRVVSLFSSLSRSFVVHDPLSRSMEHWLFGGSVSTLTADSNQNEDEQEGKLDATKSAMKDSTEACPVVGRTDPDVEDIPVIPERKVLRFTDEVGRPLEVVHILDNSDLQASNKLVVLALDPRVRKFEFVQVEYRLNSDICVSDLLHQLPLLVTSERFQNKQYTSLLQMRHGGSEMLNCLSLSGCQLERNEVLVAVSSDLLVEDILNGAQSLLTNEKIMAKVKRARRAGRGLKHLLSAKELEEETALRKKRQLESKNCEGEWRDGDHLTNRNDAITEKTPVDYSDPTSWNIHEKAVQLLLAAGVWLAVTSQNR